MESLQRILGSLNANSLGRRFPKSRHFIIAWSSLFSTEVTANVRVVCCCDFSVLPIDRLWHGRIVGKGLHGSAQALFARIQTFKSPLMGISIVCAECDGELAWENEAGFATRLRRETSGHFLLRVTSEKELENLMLSHVIFMEGVLMDSLTTIDSTGKWRRWWLVQKPVLMDRFV